ncbi:MAG: VOC family protein [Streptococcaceae bacterium]|nr:VOC family protein [Streptococcaceae bacterium]
MINHFGIAVKDCARSKQFYDAALKPLGYKIHRTGAGGTGYTDGISHDPFGDFCFFEGEPYPFHYAFEAKSNEAVDEFYKGAIENGGIDNGAPGYRKDYHENYYAAFIIDPDGYRIEAVCHNGQAHGLDRDFLT